MHRRAFLLVPALLALPSAAAADCALLAPDDEARRARHVFEGRVVAVDGGSMTFDVIAVWKGNPPARVTVAGMGRWMPPSGAMGQTWLVFAAGDDDAHLGMSRCGSSGRLPASDRTLAALAGAGLSRRTR